MAPYLFRLDERLSRGLERLSSEQRDRHRQFLISQQNTDGGFGGRGLMEDQAVARDDDEASAATDRESDLYYTAFAIRALAALKSFYPEDARQVARYLDQSRGKQGSVIDVLSWMYSSLMVQAMSGIDLLADADSDWPQKLAETLETFRTSDGGYAKTHEGAAGSTYHSFLVLLCYQLIGQPLPQPEKLVRFVCDRQREDGGFVEIAPMKRSGTNPTAAAIAILTILDSMSDVIRGDVLEYLKEVRSDEGGFQANTRIPFADSLSTFTGYLTCVDVGAADILHAGRLQRFILSLEQPTGGFRAATWDNATDVEYTFYALGTLGLIWSQT